MGFLLLVPFLLVRFGLLALLDRAAIRRAAYFAPLEGAERIAYWVYLPANLAIFVYPFFLRIKLAPGWLFYTGAGIYAAGMLLLVASIVYFAAPNENGINRRGVYRFSRNPMYVAYFLVFVGCAALTQSILLLAFALVFQVSAHWIILAEERWCAGRFGEEYAAYRQRVRRYL